MDDEVNKMFEDIKNLYDDIIYATKNIDEKLDIFKSINGATICIGVGGSKVVAKYAEKVLAKKNKLIAITMEPHSFLHYDYSLYENIFIVSHSGKNYGVKACLDNNLNSYLLSTRKSNIKDENIINYDMPNRHSFISISDTIIPMAILLKYYLGNKFSKTLDKIFASIDKTLSLENSTNINIYTGFDSEAASFFLESTLIESGLNTPIVNYKYDYCHGRSTINKNHDKEAILLGYDKTDLDKTLLNVLNKSMKRIVVLKKISQDDIINDFYFTLSSVYITANLAKNKHIDLKKIDYDRESVKELYYFKGSM